VAYDGSIIVMVITPVHHILLLFYITYKTILLLL